LVAEDHDYIFISPSELVDIGGEVLLDEPSHKVCLGVHLQPLYLSHILEEHIGRDLIVGVSSEAVLEVVKVEAEADQPADSLASNTGARLAGLQLSSGRVHSLEKCED